MWGILRKLWNEGNRFESNWKIEKKEVIFVFMVIDFYMMFLWDRKNEAYIVGNRDDCSLFGLDFGWGDKIWIEKISNWFNYLNWSLESFFVNISIFNFSCL